MSQNSINPDKLTKPIQLLAAWLVGLLSISSSFLVAAANIDIAWQSGLLVIAAVINVPLFLSAVFLLQTKFRPELQEDSYYSSYLSNKTNTLVKISRFDAHFIELNSKIEKLERLVINDESVCQDINENRLARLTIGINIHLDDRDDIKLILARHNILKITRFGPAHMPLAKRIMSLSIHLPEETHTQLIMLCKEIGMDGYNYFDNIEEQAKEDVLIGSYGNIEYETSK